MKRLYIVILFIALSINVLTARSWDKDFLGENFLSTKIAMPNDYSGKVVTTVVKRIAAISHTKSILYLHGYNDYFFQEEMANEFNKHGYGFYAVDLRKYGRSWLNEQKRFEVRDLKEYFADIDSAINIIREDGYKDIVLMGHSTGGLISAYYMVKGSAHKNSIKAMILNSPFLDMNLSDIQENSLLPLVSAISGMFPNISIEQNSNDAYAQSLLKKYHGEWEYNTDWKLPLSPAVTSGWIGAIYKAQKYLQRGQDITIPILLMRSDKSVGGNSWSPEFNKGDAVLNVNEISIYGKKLGVNVKELVVKNGLHDLMLSSKPVRVSLYDYMFKWLEYNVN